MNMCPVVSPPFKASLLSHVPFYHTNLVINVSRISARAHLRRGDGVEPERGRRGARGGAGMMREVKSAIVYLEVSINIPSPLRFLTSSPSGLEFFDNLYNWFRTAPVREPFCVRSLGQCGGHGPSARFPNMVATQIQFLQGRALGQGGGQGPSARFPDLVAVQIQSL